MRTWEDTSLEVAREKWVSRAKTVADWEIAMEMIPGMRDPETGEFLGDVQVLPDAEETPLLNLVVKIETYRPRPTLQHLPEYQEPEKKRKASFPAVGAKRQKGE